MNCQWAKMDFQVARWAMERGLMKILYAAREAVPKV
jgi:hypothetical protein